MKDYVPQTPAEQQAVIEDAEAQLRDDDGSHNKRVLREMYATLQRKAPELWARIRACDGCAGTGLIGYEEQERPGIDGLPERVRVGIECPDCRADRLEYAALIGY